MSDVDRVAEAIWRADRHGEGDEPATWADCMFPDYYRGLARAALDALPDERRGG